MGSRRVAPKCTNQLGRSRAVDRPVTVITCQMLIPPSVQGSHAEGTLMLSNNIRARCSGFGQDEVDDWTLWRLALVLLLSTVLIFVSRRTRHQAYRDTSLHLERCTVARASFPGVLLPRVKYWRCRTSIRGTSNCASDPAAKSQANQDTLCPNKSPGLDTADHEYGTLTSCSAPTHGKHICTNRMLLFLDCGLLDANGAFGRLTFSSC